MHESPLERLVGAIVVPAVLGLVAIGFAGIVLRYAFGGAYALFWAEELIRYGFIWVFWLVAPIALRHGSAFAVDMLVERLPHAARLSVTLLGNLAVMVLLGIYVYQGAVMTRLNGGQLSTALEVPMAWVYAAIPVGSAAMFGVIALQTLRMLRTGSLPHREETTS